MNPAVTPIKSSTQSFLEIEDIKDDLIILQDGSCALVIATSATNFGLLSEKEQDTEIYAYGALLNSLNFTIQILIRSQKKDITSYLNLLEAQEEKTPNLLLKERIHQYRTFIHRTVQRNNVLEKKFYLVIPMSSLELGVSTTFKKKTAKITLSREELLERAKTNLFPKRDHLFRLLNRLNLKPRQLTSQDLIRLFFEIYNPESEGVTLAEGQEYETPLVSRRPDKPFKKISRARKKIPTAVVAPAAPPAASQPVIPSTAVPTVTPAIIPPPVTPPAPAVSPSPVPGPNSPLPEKITDPETGLQTTIDQWVTQGLRPQAIPVQPTSQPQPIFNARPVQPPAPPPITTRPSPAAAQNPIKNDFPVSPKPAL